MAKQQFSNAFREALWEVHGERCIYCSRPIAFMAMEIDHIIPESLLNDQEVLQSLLRRLGVPAGFDLLGYENLALACSTCNKDKRDHPLADGALMIKLAQVADRLARLGQSLERRRTERDLDNTLRHIARSIEANRFTREELLNGLDFARRMPGGIYGASPTAPPPSPEERHGGSRIRDESRIIWTQRAVNDMTNLNLNAGELNDLLYLGVKDGLLNVKKLTFREDLFAARIGHRLRVVFMPGTNGTTVLRVLHRGRAI